MVDQDAVEPQPAKSPLDDDDEGDDLANMFGKLGVSKIRKCQVCQVE
jgi:hypothetical protein